VIELIDSFKELVNKRAIIVHDDGQRSDSVTGIIKEIGDDSVRIETDAFRSIWINTRYIIKIKEVR